MKRPSITAGVIVAFCLSIIAVIFLEFELLFYLYPQHSTAKLSLACVLTCYVFYLLWARKNKRGSILVLCSVLGLAFVGIVLLPTLYFVLFACLVLWALRSLLWHRCLLSSAADAVLCGAGLILAVISVLHTGSFIAAVWSFFLLQALFVLIPERFSFNAGKERVEVAYCTERANVRAEDFERAHRTAENAIAQMI